MRGRRSNSRTRWRMALALALAVPAARAADPASGPGQEVYQAQVAGDPACLGYWPLAGSLQRTAGVLALEAGHEPLAGQPGPLGDDRSVDLSGNQFLRIPPVAALDAPELSIELFCKIRQTIAGCLVGLRDGDATRFSLHITADSSSLAFWNGEQVTTFEAPVDLEPGRWYHVALATSAAGTTVWVNGTRCLASGPAGFNAAATGLPLVVGTVSADTGRRERAETAVAHLAVHAGRLTTEAVQARLAALNWSERMKLHPRTEGVESADLDARIARIKQDYGVDVHYKFDHKQFIPAIWHNAMRGRQIPLGQAEVMLTEIERFLTIVPRPVTVKNLENIYMFRSLEFGDGGGMGGMAYARNIYLCAGSAAHVRHSLFHEFSHILEVAHPIDRQAWMAPLPPDFQYLGRKANDNPYYHDDAMRGMGFILRYSTMSLGEEVAVLSDYVFAREKETQELMRKHPAIRNRVALLIARYKAIHADYDFSAYDGVLAETAGEPPHPMASPPVDPAAEPAA